MADYRKMYMVLCSAASEAIDASPEEARRLLQNTLQEAEEIYIDTCEDEPKLSLLGRQFGKGNRPRAAHADGSTHPGCAVVPV